MPATIGAVQDRAWSIVTSIPEIDATTAIVGIVSLVILFGGARLAPRVPWGLVVLIGAIVASSVFDLAAQGVVTVGSVPQGLPPLGLPGIPVDDLAPVAFGGLAIALVGLARG